MDDTARGPCPTCPKGKCPEIDTTPIYQEPPSPLIEAAMRDVPDELYRADPNYAGGPLDALALRLLKFLCLRGHSQAAAAWAIHRLVVEGKLTAHMVPTELPTIMQSDGTFWPPDPRTWIGLPETGPVPFHQFIVRAEPSLWELWHKGAVDTPTGPIAPVPERRLPGRPKADYETQQREAGIAAEWKRAHESGVSKLDFAKEKGMKLKDLQLLLDRVRQRKRPSKK